MSHRTEETQSLTGSTHTGSKGSPGGEEEFLGEKVRALEEERAHLSQKILELRAEQQQLLERYISLEDQNSTLTTLYVACQRLHSSLDRKEVLLIVGEIITNLVGCEEYVLFNLEPDGWLRRVDSFGVDPAAYENIQLGQGLIGSSVERGGTHLRGESHVSAITPMDQNLTACIPLKRNGVVAGAIALFRLLPQKLELQELDCELFWLLESHLAPALYCTELDQSVKTSNGATA